MTEIRVVKPTPADVEAALQSPFYKGYLAGQRSSPAPAFSGFSDTEDRNAEKEPRTEAGKALLADIQRAADSADVWFTDDGRDYIEVATASILAIEEQAAKPSDVAYLCPHDLDLRIHPRCYLCEPQVKEPE